MKNKIINFFKENYLPILFLILVIILFYVPTNYDIDCDGGLIDLYDRIEVSPSYRMNGSINLTYVGGRRGTVASLLLSLILPSWDAYKISDYLVDGETYNEQLARGKVSLREATQNSIYVALKESGRNVEIKRFDVTVILIDKKATTTLEVGDIIKDVEGKKINNSNDLSDIINTHEVGDTINITVLRENETKKVTAKVREEDGVKLVGIYINPIIELSYDYDIKIEFNSEANEYGSSGGLMNSLLIYNKLTEEDITKGDVISGTGVINIDGSVDEIAGVKYKLRGAYKQGADVFIAPTANYKEALEIKDKYKMDIEIIEAKTFTQVIEELKNRKN